MGFCKSDQKNIPVVGFLTRNDCDVLRAKTGVYRWDTHRTIIPSCPVLRMGCPQNNSASSMALHTSSLSPNSFFLSLTSTSVRNLLQPFHALLDSGPSHSFVNEAFAMNNKLKFSYLPNPIPLKMFDGSTPSNVSQKVQMPITFSTGEMHHLEFYITNLDENYSLVLQCRSVIVDISVAKNPNSKLGFKLKSYYKNSI